MSEIDDKLKEIMQKIEDFHNFVQKLKDFNEMAMPIVGPDALKMVIPITALIASGGMNPGAALEALDDLHTIVGDIIKAKKMFEAQQAAVQPQQ